MRTIFITPLLWKKVNRAVRRRSEGQALVLIALTAVGMVAIVGLAIDGGLSFLEAQRIQRAADAAALAGAIWVPARQDVADARGKLAAQANGFDAVNYPATSIGDAQGDPNYQRVWYQGFLTSNSNEYGATVGHRTHRWFLGIIGFPDYSIVRSSVAAYSQLPRLGAANNYFGSSGILEDHDRMDKAGINAALGTEGPCTAANQVSWQGTGTGDSVSSYVHYYCGQYLHYLYQSCAMRPSSPIPNPTLADGTSLPCMGTFWLGMYGTDTFHNNGDAYNPAGDGGYIRDPYYDINDGLYNAPVLRNTTSSGCQRTTTATELWYYGLRDSANQTCDTSYNYNGTSTNAPKTNFQFHPDAPIDAVTNQPARGFGYEVAINVDPRVLDNNSTGTRHTALNISIWGAAFTNNGISSPYLPDNTNVNGSITGWGTPAFSNDFDSVIRNPLITTTNNNIIQYAPNTSPMVLPNTAAENVQAHPIDKNGAAITDLQQLKHLPPDNLNISRYMLFMPPAAAGTPITWASKGAPVHSINPSMNFDNQFATDVGNQNGSALIGIDLSYFNEGTPFDRSNYLALPITYTFGASGAPTSTNATTGATPGDPRYDDSTAQRGYWSNFCYIVNPQWLTPEPTITSLRTTQEQYFYVCPPHINNLNAVPSDVNADLYWNQLYGSPSQSKLTTISGGTLSGPFTTGSQNGSSTSVITNIVPMQITGTWGYGNNQEPSAPPLYPFDTTLLHTTDPHQACRSINDINWGNDRIPFNMRGSDWTSTVQDTGNPAQNIGNSSNLFTTTLATKYYSYHGQRCSWDFDSGGSGHAGGPDFNPLSDQAISNPAGCTSNPAPALLDSSPPLVSFAAQDPSLNLGNGRAFDNVQCYEPYFHITNYHWEGGNRVVNSPNAPNVADGAQQKTWLVGGPYLLHIQTFGGAGFHAYSVKAEYEYALPVTNTVNGAANVINNYPVPDVYAISSMTIFANAGAAGGQPNNVIFDLANIPAANAGFTGVIELWDPGDVFATRGSNTYENLSILKPSGFGRGYSYPNSAGVYTTDPSQANGLQVPFASRALVIQYVQIYPFNNRIAGGSTNSNIGITNTVIEATGINDPTGRYEQHLNDEWIYMAFQLPGAQEYNAINTTCAANGVPDSECFYYQIAYTVSSTGVANDIITYANDITTWELYIQNQPVHLIR